MKYKAFNDRVKLHMKEVNEYPYGKWQGKSSNKDGKEFYHILNIDGLTQNEKRDKIKEYLLPEAKISPFLYDGNHGIKLHTYAHHLNSSQIMCYNFFRPLMKDENSPSEKMIELFNEFCPLINISNEAKCSFEYVESCKENTNFDFYLEGGDVEIYCEIKYTEQSFGKKSNAEDENEQYDSVYKDMIESADIWKDGKKRISESDFNSKYYQLTRNAIRSIGKNKYVFFVISSEREDLLAEFENFSDFLNCEAKERIRIVTWKDLVRKASEIGINTQNFEDRYILL